MTRSLFCFKLVTPTPVLGAHVHFRAALVPRAPGWMACVFDFGRLSYFQVCLDLFCFGRKASFVTGMATSSTLSRRLTASAVCVAWLLAVLTCASFGQPMAPDEPVVSHELANGVSGGHADTDLCCKALGDSATVLQVLKNVRPDLVQAPSPLIAIAETLRTEQLSARPLERPPPVVNLRTRAKRLIAFSSHAPPAFHI